jgi:hypothetical protein
MKGWYTVGRSTKEDVFRFFSKVLELQTRCKVLYASSALI